MPPSAHPATPALAATLLLLVLLLAWPPSCAAAAPAVLPPAATTRASQERGHGVTYGVGAHGQVRRGRVFAAKTRLFSFPLHRRAARASATDPPRPHTLKKKHRPTTTNTDPPRPHTHKKTPTTTNTDRLALTHTKKTSITTQEEWRGEAIQVSAWAPRATLFKAFLTPAECAHLRALATPSLTASTVVDTASGEPVPSAVRTSSGTFLEPAQDAVVAGIERRIALATHLPVENGEALQVLHYSGDRAEKYEPHLDAFHGDDPKNSRPEVGGQRVATVLMYLATPAEGGETVFPQAAAKAAGPGWSACAREGLAVAPVAGDALLFYSTTPDGAVDFASLHGSCPTTRGDKWTATRWVHGGPYGDANPLARARGGECVDGSSDCAAWAAAGECAKNPGFMLASCRVSCGSCGGGSGGSGGSGSGSGGSGGTVAV
jgi:prolyl 4-hydroxylase